MDEEQILKNILFISKYKEDALKWLKLFYPECFKDVKNKWRTGFNKMENKEYYLKEIKKVLDKDETLFKIKITGFMEEVETKNLTLPRELLILIFNSINNDL